jgi:hypothetical protein
MIVPPAGVRVYLACGATDMRKGMSKLRPCTGSKPFGTVFRRDLG